MAKTSKTKKLLFSGTIVLVMYLAAEGIAYMGYGVTQGSLFSWSDFQMARQRVIDDYQGKQPQLSPQKTAEIKRGRKEVIHPYLGYVIDSKNEECSIYGFCDWRIIGAKNSPVTLEAENKFVVGVFGGSFAHGASTAHRRGYFEGELRTIPQLSGKEIVVHSIAMGGYKQPQQLMALNYFLMLGAQYDLIINIDGFNEVVLPPFENLSKQVFPSFPRNWFNRVGKVSDLVANAMLGKIAYYESERGRWAEKFFDSPLRYSVIGNLVWLYRSKRYARKAQLFETEYAQYKVTGKQIARYVVHGPPFEYSTEADVYDRLAQVWSRSSLQMSILSKGLGIEYIHFLQPNQYVEGSKPMTAEERKAAILDYHPYKEYAETGYPYLIREGEWLKQHGVNYHDLTLMFEDNEEILYRDQCCHLNERGYDLIVDRIMQEVKKLYR